MLLSGARFEKGGDGFDGSMAFLLLTMMIMGRTIDDIDAGTCAAVSGFRSPDIQYR